MCLCAPELPACKKQLVAEQGFAGASPPSVVFCCVHLPVCVRLRSLPVVLCTRALGAMFSLPNLMFLELFVEPAHVEGRAVLTELPRLACAGRFVEHGLLLIALAKNRGGYVEAQINAWHCQWQQDPWLRSSPLALQLWLNVVWGNPVTAFSRVIGIAVDVLDSPIQYIHRHSC